MKKMYVTFENIVKYANARETVPTAKGEPDQSAANVALLGKGEGILDDGVKEDDI